MQIKEFQEVANYDFTAVHAAGNNPSQGSQGQPPSIPRPPPVPRPPVCMSNGLGAHWAGTGRRVRALQAGGGAYSSAGATAGSSGVALLADLDKDIAQISPASTIPSSPDYKPPSNSPESPEANVYGPGNLIMISAALFCNLAWSSRNIHNIDTFD